MNLQCDGSVCCEVSLANFIIPGGRLLLSVALPVERQPNVMSVFVSVCSIP